MGLKERWNQLRPDRMSTVFVDGVSAGFLAGLVVLATFSAYDIATTEVLRTPTVLHAHFVDGAATAAGVETDPQRAFAYTFVHFVLWFGFGLAAAYLIALHQLYPVLWYIAVLGPAALLCLFLWSAGVWGVPGLGVHHLWVGALLGSAVMGGYFVWRNPGLLEHTAEP